MNYRASICTWLTALTLSAGCATTSGLPEVPLNDPGPLAQNWLPPSRILDGKTGAQLDEAELVRRLLAARVIYVAEKHDRAQDHAVQLRVLHLIAEQDRSVGVGFEMFKRPFQKWLSDYAAGRIDESQMLKKTEWQKRWGFKPALYRPILEYVRQYNLQAYALNARDEITRAVARKGIDHLDPRDRAALPDLDLKNADHRAVLQGIFDEHGMKHGKMSFENFYTAQVIWDETMAHEVAQELARADAPQRIVVLAGSGHIKYGHGIPSRAARRGATPGLTVYPVVDEGDPRALQALIDEGAADILWLMRP